MLDTRRASALSYSKTKLLSAMSLVASNILIKKNFNSLHTAQAA